MHEQHRVWKSRTVLLFTSIHPSPAVGSSTYSLHKIQLCEVDKQIQLDNCPPLLQRHYSAFITTTEPSAPVPCIGTLALAESLL
jgi:hypothetical protein